MQLRRYPSASTFLAGVGEYLLEAEVENNLIIGIATVLASGVQERTRSAQLFVWDDAGPVSIAGWSGKTPNGVRVNLVFTPPELRGHGYASAAVAALSRQLLDQGNRYCCLYTGVANPISNAIYARIGYRPVCEAGMYALAL